MHNVETSATGTKGTQVPSVLITIYSTNKIINVAIYNENVA